MSNIKLGVEVVSAHDLMPKDSQGSASPYVELHFDHQEFQTTIKEKDLDPFWNETFYFNISDPNNLSNLTLFVYNSVKGKNPNPFMGKVHINGTSFVPYSDAVVSHYPLEKRNILSSVKGELGLKVFIVDNPSITSSNPIPQMDNTCPINGLKERTFQHLPNPNLQQQSQFTSQKPYMASSSELFQYSVKETEPFLGGGQIIRGRVVNSDNKRGNTYDLVEAMQFLFVRVVKAQDLPTMDVTGSLDPYVEVRVGNHKGITQHFSKTSNPEWNTVFAFLKERMQASVLEVVVKDKDMIKDDLVGVVRVNLHDIPTRVPPDNPLAPEWYRLEDEKGEKKKGQLILAVWIGTQADEAFPDAFLLDAGMSNVDSSVSSMDTRPKVYYSPRLWYVHVNIIEVQDLVWAEKSRFPEVYVKAQINDQVSRTRPVQVRTANVLWNEDMVFVAAEPLEDHLILSIEDRVGPGDDEVLGKVYIPLNSVERRTDDRIVKSRWFNLQDPGDNEIDEKKKKKDECLTQLHLRVCLDGEYHVVDESTQYSSDLRPTTKQLREPSIGMLDIGILNASDLQPMKIRNGKGTIDAYCVAKYGHKWVRTRTVVDNLAPRFNEQYTWEVYDHSTVLTVGVFDNAELESRTSKNVHVGRIRIHISALKTGRVYSYSYPLFVLHPTGVKKMGELHLAIRFSSTSMMNTTLTYSKPLLPKMHFFRPLTIVQLEMLRHQAVEIVSDRLGRAEPPLGREIVEYMTDANPHLWNMRQSKAIFFRLMLLFDWVFTVSKGFEEICSWKNVLTTVMAHILLTMLVFSPESIPTVFFIIIYLIVLMNTRFREQYVPHMNTRLSYAEVVNPDELDKEFDMFPMYRSLELVRHRYHQLGCVSGRIQSVVGDIVSRGEQIQGLLTWRDSRATLIFLMVIIGVVFVLSVTPVEIVVLFGGFYVMRHPRFRGRLPSAPMNFFRRLAAYY